MEGEQPRLAELIGSLSLATDLAAGLGAETALRTCVLAVELGRAVGLTGDDLRDVYYAGVLRFIGCTALSSEMAHGYGGDDMAVLAAMTPADVARPTSLLRTAVTRVGRGTPTHRRIRTVARVLASPTLGSQIATAHCQLAMMLAARLGMSERVVGALGQIYERYDGKGAPHGLRGAQIATPARVMHVAFRAAAHLGIFGAAEALAVVRERGGGELDPALAAAFVRHGAELLAAASGPSVWDTYLDAEPLPVTRIDSERVGQIALAFAHYADVKSRYTLGHSTGVARLAAAAGRVAGLPASECDALHLAGLLHDLGRISVPSGIWEKAGPLGASEWERVRMHAYHGERILARSPLFAETASLAGMHHERLDGSGYHRGAAGAGVSRAARILAAADVYQALTEQRPHRRALAPTAAAQTLAAEATAGRLDTQAVAQVLAAAGQRPPRQPRGAASTALTAREAEVLALLARGLSNKQIGGRLVLSPSTVKNHIAHIYEKTGISTRAAAAVYAVDHDLLQDGPNSP